MARYRPPMNVHTPKLDKYKAYRARKKAAGLKQVRIWTLDPDAPGFKERMATDWERINASQSEQEVVRDIENGMAEDSKEWPAWNEEA
ncbi:antitoxin MazE-like protein [Brevundimonas sp.]|uniref:antitoxin MazE-like protein n=1 Tax=Brevundimonas sp. TaxID=1871086 RepID=UPI002AB86659|nr:antitoxin MazE-like protein [Brevundimonas sp.]MDZ4364825.1 antitoxin MazE-like protein [Brevundimonas sp.]